MARTNKRNAGRRSRPRVRAKAKPAKAKRPATAAKAKPATAATTKRPAKAAKAAKAKRPATATAKTTRRANIAGRAKLARRAGTTRTGTTRARPAGAVPARAAGVVPPRAKTGHVMTARATDPIAVDGLVRLGEVTAPSGKLAVFDVGLIGYLPREALEPALVIADVPRDRVLPVLGRRVGTGQFADCWHHVIVKLAEGEVAMARKLGEAGVDFARLVCMDHGALDAWQHEDSLDGLADFVFWGRDAGDLARAIHAPSLKKDGYGWRDLPVAEAEARADAAERLKAKHHWLLATDLRPHSDHHHALAAARRSKQGAGTIEVGGAKVCLFFTSWGDGVFPIYLELDHDDRAIQIRIQLDTADTMRGMRAVSPSYGRQ